MALKKLAQVDELAKAAKPGDEFVLVPKSALVGKNADGHILLKGTATVSSVIRKEDLDSAGYGADATDDMGGDEGMEGKEAAKQEAMGHMAALEKCHGFLKKFHGIEDEDMGEEAGEGSGEHGDNISGDMGATKARKAGNLRKSASASEDRISKMLADHLTATKALLEESKTTTLAARKGTEGALVQKNGTAPVGVEALKSEIETLRLERKDIIAKRDGGIPMTPVEQLRATKINEEISKLEETYSEVMRKVRMGLA